MKRLLGYVVAIVLLGSTVYAQTFRGAINGTVTDPSGAMVSGASVKATNVGTAVSVTTTTTSGGEFAFQDLAIGTYKIEVTMSGFRQAVIDNVSVTAGNVYTLPVRLSAGSAGTTIVEVSAAALTLDTTTATQSDTIPTENLQNIPLNGRDFSQLIAVTPGYSGYSGGGGGNGTLNGTRANQVNWQVDGTDNNDFWHNIQAINQGGVSGIAGVVMPIDAIDEFSTQTQSNAETGRNAGGTLNIVIKSGTNDIHGSAYYYNRNEFYAASSPFLTPGKKSPPLRNQNYGFTFGGPIIKNKTFYFFGFEKQNYIFGLTGLATEPSDAWVAQARAKLTAGGVPENTLSDSLLGALWPSSIRGLANTSPNYFPTVPGTGYSYNEVGKIDHNFNEKNHLLFHFFYGQGSQTQPPGASLTLATASSDLGYYFEAAPIRIENYSLVWNSVFSSRLTNQVLFGISYFNQIFHDANNTFDQRALGLFTSPDALINGKPIHGAPSLSISGFDAVGVTPPEGRNDITGHLEDALSYTVGKHQLRFGGEVRQGRVDEFYFRRSLGSFNFTGAYTLPNGLPGNPWSGTCAISDPTCALADFLAGDVSTASIALGDAERKVRANAFDIFAQDAWQVTPRFNLNLGLRYDYMGPLHSVDKDLALFLPTRGLLVQGAGIDSIFPPDHANFAPRLGFSYQPTTRGDLVVRGGFGIFYDQINMNPFLDFRPPISGADGLADNPIGPHSVANYSASSFTWQANKAIFPVNVPCPTLSGCVDPNTGTALSYNVYSVGQSFKTPYFYNYNLQLEKGFGNGAAVWQVGYVGSVGHRLLVVDNITTPALQTAFPDLSSALQINSAGNSNYNSLQSTVRFRSWHGLAGQVAYTLGHALDTMTEYRGQIQTDLNNPRLDYGNADFDTRNTFSAFWSYDIPGSSHGPKILTHGWQVSSMLLVHGGEPFNFNGGNLAFSQGSGAQRPGMSVIGDPFAGVSHSFNRSIGGVQWVNPAVFCVPDGGITCPGAVGGPGNLSRNKYYAPGYADLDLSVFKNVPITERFKLQLRAEMFNVFNRINYATGAGSVSTKGVVSDTIGDFFGSPGLGPGEPFNLQIAAKIIF